MTDKIVKVRKQSPKQITNFGTRAAKQLVDIVKQNKWNVNIQGNDYLRFEAWQTVGRFFGYTVKTEKTNYIELGEAKGFEATAVVLDSEGQVVGGADSVCMSDEKQWASKPLYALKSMAQTRASARALRQILSWVVVLAGYKPTPVEEIGAEVVQDLEREKQIDSWHGKDQLGETSSGVPTGTSYSGKVDRPASEPQKRMIFAVAKDKGLDPEKTKEAIKSYFKLNSYSDLTVSQAKKAIDNLLKKADINSDQVQA